MEDRVIRGFTAGVVGGVAMNVWGFYAGSAKLTTLRIADWAGIMIYGRTPPFDSVETLFALLGQLVFAGTLGVLFCLLIPLLSSRFLLFKGWLYSVAVWFVIYAITNLFKVEGIFPLPLKTVFANFVAATLFGLTLAAVLGALGAEAPGFSRRVLTSPAMKQDGQDGDDANDKRT